jgi:hypothetical protein
VDANGVVVGAITRLDPFGTVNVLGRVNGQPPLFIITGNGFDQRLDEVFTTADCTGQPVLADQYDPASLVSILNARVIPAVAVTGTTGWYAPLGSTASGPPVGSFFLEDRAQTCATDGDASLFKCTSVTLGPQDPADGGYLCCCVHPLATQYPGFTATVPEVSVDLTGFVPPFKVQ